MAKKSSKAKDGKEHSGQAGAQSVPASAEMAAEQALDSAGQAVEKIRTHTLGDAAAAAAARGQPLELHDMTPGQSTEGIAAGLGLLDDIDLDVRVELGRTQMYVEDVLRLNENSVVELDKAAGDPVDIFVNDRHVARGEVLVLNENFCVRISEIIREADSSEVDD